MPDEREGVWHISLSIPSSGEGRRMAEGKKKETDGEQHSPSLVNSSCEISERQDLPSMGTKNQHSAPQFPRR